MIASFAADSRSCRLRSSCQGIEKLIEIMFEYDGPRWLYISSALQSERLFACALSTSARDLFLPQQQFELRVVRDVVFEFGPVDAENIRIRRGTQRPVRGVANPACEPVNRGCD